LFPIAKDALSFLEISDYWSREIKPRASWEELFHSLTAAWWLGELRGDSVHSPFQLLKEIFTSMRHRDDLGVVFLVGNSAGPPPIEMPNGSVPIDVRPQIRVPSENIESWDQISCRDAFQALAETRLLDSFPELAVSFGSVSLSYQEFTAWLAKSGYTEPTFWRPDQQGSKKRWHAKPGDKNKLTPHEDAVLSALNELFPDGELGHKAKQRNVRINQFFVKSDRSQVSPRVIQRTLAKIAFG
jgi:hypothetical protein